MAKEVTTVYVCPPTDEETGLRCGQCNVSLEFLGHISRIPKDARFICWPCSKADPKSPKGIPFKRTQP